MAYREFRNEETYKAPEIGDLMPRTLGVMDTAMKVKAQREQQNRSLQDNYKIANQYGYFPQNQNEINNDTQKAVQIMNAWKMNGGQGIPPGVKEIMANTEAKGNRGRALWEALKQKEESVKALKVGDPYYKDTEDLKLIEKAYDPNLTLDQIEELTGQLAPGKNKLATFNEAKYLDDAVKEIGEKSTGTSTTGENGVKFSNDYKGKLFLDDGTPGVSDKHVNNVLERNPDAKEYYTQKVLKDVGDEYQQILSGRVNEIPDTEQGNSLKSLITHGYNDEAIQYLREHPELNPINKKTEFERISDKVKPALKERESVQSKRESDVGNRIPNSNWGIGNKNATNASDGFDNGPMRVVLTKTGTGENKLPYVYVKAGMRRNADTNEVTQGGDSSVPSIVKNYKWTAIGSDGAPMDIKFKNNDELEAQLKKMPLLERIKMSAAPVLNVKTVDKSTVLDIAYSYKLDQLKEESQKDPEGDVAKELPEIQKALDQINAGESFNSQLIQKYFGADVVKNELIPVGKNDVNDTGYEAATGIRPTSEKSMNTEMKKTREIIERVKKEAIQENKRLQTVENGKAVNNANQAEGLLGNKKVVTKSAPIKYKSAYNVNGKSMNLDELKKSYSESELDEFIKAGILK